MFFVFDISRDDFGVFFLIHATLYNAHWFVMLRLNNVESFLNTDRA